MHNLLDNAHNHNGLRQSPSSKQQTGTRLQSWLTLCPYLAKTTTRYLLGVAPKSQTYSAELTPPTKTSLQYSISRISELKSPVNTRLERWPGICHCRHIPLSVAAPSTPNLHTGSLHLSSKTVRVRTLKSPNLPTRSLHLPSKPKMC